MFVYFVLFPWHKRVNESQQDSFTVFYRILLFDAADEHRPVQSVKVRFFTDMPMAVNEANIGRYRYAADTDMQNK